MKHPLSAYWRKPAMPVPRLAAFASWINEHTVLTAEVERSYTNTDRKVGRLRAPGKGRHGNRLLVRDAKGREIFSHDSSQTYRHNSEVLEWLQRLLRENPKIEK